MSDDGGRTWTRAIGERPPPPEVAPAMLAVCDPDRPARCARASSADGERPHEVSDDGGVTWRPVAGRPALLEGFPAFAQGELHAACAPSLTNECYRALSGAHTDRLERSVDGGRTWVRTLRAPYLLRDGVRLRVTDLAIVPQGDSYAVVVALGPWGVLARPDGGAWSTAAVAGTERVHLPHPFSDHATAPAVWGALLGLVVWGLTLYFGWPGGGRVPGWRRWSAAVVAVAVGSVALAFAVREVALLLGGDGILVRRGQVPLAGIPIGLVSLLFAAGAASRFQAQVLQRRVPPTWWLAVPAFVVWIAATYQIVDSISALR